MPRRLLNRLIAAVLALGLPLAAAAEEPREKVGLFTTLPIYWPEAQGVSELLGPDAVQPWAREEIEQRFDLTPLDVLAGEGANLYQFRRLLLAQPRMLSSAENVALDAWVREGGRLLLFADPMLTGETMFEVGDKRRPQDVALLSPILAHWGLELRFDEDQPAGERLATIGTVDVPVNRAGRFGHFAPDVESVECSPRAGGLVAECRIGQGAAVIVADAALFDGPGNDPVRQRALQSLLTYAFGS